MKYNLFHSADKKKNRLETYFYFSSPNLIMNQLDTSFITVLLQLLKKKKMSIGHTTGIFDVLHEYEYAGLNSTLGNLRHTKSLENVITDGEMRAYLLDPSLSGSGYLKSFLESMACGISSDGQITMTTSIDKTEQR